MFNINIKNQTFERLDSNLIFISIRTNLKTFKKKLWIFFIIYSKQRRWGGNNFKYNYKNIEYEEELRKMTTDMEDGVFDSLKTNENDMES